MNPTTNEDLVLMVRVRGGDEAAFERLHARHHRRVLRFFHGMTGAARAADDLCQETFLRVWTIRRRYHATGSFSSYLFGVARLIWLEHCRGVALARRLGLPCALDGAAPLTAPAMLEPDRRADSAALRARIFEALDALPPEQRMVFVLRTIEGLSLDDIAAALGCPVNTVRSRKILATKKLRHLLRDVRAADDVSTSWKVV